MNTPRHNDDAELRALLDSIGIRPNDSIPDDLTDEEVERAERMFAHVVAQPRNTPPMAEPTETKPTWWWTHRARSLNLAAVTAICVLVAVMILQPWGHGPNAAAQTPPMLHFTDIRTGQIKASGEPSDDLLRQLADKALSLPEPADLPVQHVELDGWWASSTAADGAAPAVTVLSPISSNAYLLPNNDRRAIERRGHPLDADGRLVDTDPDRSALPTISDTITELDAEQDVNYLDTLPETTAGLRKTLAPDDGCVQTPGGCLLSNVSSLFESYVVPPAIASRLWETLATEPSITSLGRTTDRQGREAIAFTAPALAPTEQLLLLIDPKNGQYLGSERILVATDASFGFNPPAVIAFTYLVKAERIAASDVPDASTSERY